MNYLIALVLALPTVSYACPNLTGDYICQTKFSGPVKYSITQLEENGATTYTIVSDSSVDTYKADGKTQVSTTDIWQMTDKNPNPIKIGVSTTEENIHCNDGALVRKRETTDKFFSGQIDIWTSFISKSLSPSQKVISYEYDLIRRNGEKHIEQEHLTLCERVQ